MDINGIRLQNYNLLLRMFRDRPDQAGLPAHGLLKRFAEHVSVSPRYLSHINNGRKNIGDALARRLETESGKPFGWMDRVNIESEIDAAGAAHQSTVDFYAAEIAGMLAKISEPDQLRRAFAAAIMAIDSVAGSGVRDLGASVASGAVAARAR